MKILEVINVFSAAHGGAPKVACQMAQELVERGHAVTVYTSSDGLTKDYIDSISNVKINPFKTWVNLAGFTITPGLLLKARNEVKRSDVIHMHNYRTFQNVIVHRYARMYGIPYILQAHGSLITFFQKQRMKKIFDGLWGNQILKDAAKVIAISTAEAEQYTAFGVSPDKIEIVPNGLDLSEFDKIPPRGRFREKYGLRNKDKVILYLGRIHETKGIDLLVRAFARICRDQGSTVLVIAGPDDGYLSTLERMVEELKIGDKVVFLGLLGTQEKLEAYVDADVHVSFRDAEPFGLTLIESAACGTPVICSVGCGIADIVDGRMGLAVPYSEGDLQAALQRILQDDQLRRRLGDSGKLLVREKFNWAKIVDQLEAIYEGVRKN